MGGGGGKKEESKRGGGGWCRLRSSSHEGARSESCNSLAVMFRGGEEGEGGVREGKRKGNGESNVKKKKKGKKQEDKASAGFTASMRPWDLTGRPVATLANIA